MPMKDSKLGSLVYRPITLLPMVKAYGRPFTDRTPSYFRLQLKRIQDRITRKNSITTGNLLFKTF